MTRQEFLTILLIVDPFKDYVASYGEWQGRPHPGPILCWVKGEISREPVWFACGRTAECQKAMPGKISLVVPFCYTLSPPINELLRVYDPIQNNFVFGRYTGHQFIVERQEHRVV